MSLGCLTIVTKCVILDIRERDTTTHQKAAEMLQKYETAKLNYAAALEDIRKAKSNREQLLAVVRLDFEAQGIRLYESILRQAGVKFNPLPERPKLFDLETFIEMVDASL